MAFDLHELTRLTHKHGDIVRVVICSHQGSSPREAGTAMCIWSDGDGFGQSGTIGGGALEYEAAKTARAALDGAKTGPWIERLALGPQLGQCCGGAVTLAFEPITQQSLSDIPAGGLYARPLSKDAAPEMPLALRRAQKSARNQGLSATWFAQGWLAEPVAPKARDLWIWGAGHVGRALVDVLRPLPGLQLTWIDTDRSRFPTHIPQGIAVKPHANPAELVAQAPKDAEHVIVTYSHALDLDLCHRLLGHGFSACGVIGSASKWARFRSRLGALGHLPTDISRIACPIGDPSLGKHPQAIAISVAASVLSPQARALNWEEAL